MLAAPSVASTEAGRRPVDKTLATLASIVSRFADLPHAFRITHTNRS
jgi:hypothetical protein